MNSIEAIDQIIYIKKEKIAGKGEDSCCFDNVSRPGATMLSVFDGCGGAGAKKYVKLGNHSGAYIGSRVVCGIVFDWFRGLADLNNESTWTMQIHDMIQEAFAKYRECDESRSVMRGSLAKEFPTTMSGSIILNKNTGAEANFLWAGDSRGYVLDANGLHQMTQDDVNDADALNNLMNDGAMTNVISGSKDFEIHTNKCPLYPGSMVICSTDGCFGYLESPIHFEYMLLSYLMESNSHIDWKNKVTDYLARVSGDDFTMLIAFYGFKDFNSIKATYYGRLRYIESNYITYWDNASEDERRILWEKYRNELG